MFARLRHNILIARLKVSLDKELNGTTTPAHRALTEMKLPPMRPRRRNANTGACCKVKCVSSSKTPNETISQLQPAAAAKESVLMTRWRFFRYTGVSYRMNRCRWDCWTFQGKAFMTRLLASFHFLNPRNQ